MGGAPAGDHAAGGESGSGNVGGSAAGAASYTPTGGTAAGAGGMGGASLPTAAIGGSVAGGAGAAAGSGGSPAAGAPIAGSRDSHFPLVAGSRWTYHHSGGTKAAWDETDTMQASTYQNKPAVEFADQEDAQGAQTHSTFVVQGTGVYRSYKEVTISGQTALTVRYDPAFLRYDEAWLTNQQQVTLDDAWTQTCVFSSVAKTCAPGAVKMGTTTHQYTVLAASTSVTVPAGTFDAVEIQRVDPNTAETKRYWFARGVGKVRDETPATGEVTELTAYTIP